MNKTSFDVFGRMGKESIANAKNCCKQIIALTQTNRGTCKVRIYMLKSE